MSHAVHDQYNEVTDRLQSLASHEQDFACVLVEERVAEAVVVVVIGRQVWREQQCHLRHVDSLVKQADDETTELVDDKLTRTDAVDVGGLQLATAQPLRILHVYVGLRIVSSCATKTVQYCLILNYMGVCDISKGTV